MNWQFFPRTRLVKRGTILMAAVMIILLRTATPVGAGMDSWIGNGGPRPIVYALAIDPSSPGTIYAGTSGKGVYRSADGGTSWSAINIGLTNLGVRALIIDPLTPTTVYAGASGGGVFKSVDGGTSWSAVNTGLINLDVRALAIDPLNPGNLYAGTRNGGMFRSTNGGTSWIQANTGLTSTSVQAIALDPSALATLYAGTGSGGVFKSTDGGTNWAPVNSGFTGTSVTALTVDPSTSTTLYATNGGQAFKSVNGGESWTPFGTSLPSASVRALIIDPVAPSTIYVPTGDGGAFKSTDGGANWSQINNGLTTVDVRRSFAIDPTNPNTLYAGTGAGGIFKSTDGGQNWGPINAGLATTAANKLTVDPENPATLYAATGVGVFKSTDGGRDWLPLTNGLPAATSSHALAVDPFSPNTVYAGGASVGVYKSTDGGGSWSAINTGLTSTESRDIRSLAIHPSMPSIVYAGTKGGVYKSANGGTSWSATGAAPGGNRVVVLDPSDPTIIYAGASVLGMSKSVDGGASRSQINDGLTNLSIHALAIDPATPTTVYVATAAGGIFKSTNGGTNWGPIGAGLTIADVRALAIDPSNPAIIYAGTNGDGVFRSADGGTNWRPFQNDSITSLAVYSLAISPTGPATIYAGTRDGGVNAGAAPGNHPGDVNHDGATNLADAVLALRVSSALPAPAAFADADVNRDGKVGTAEAIYALQKLAGLRDDAVSTYTLSGRIALGGVGLSGVTVTLSGAAAATTTTDVNGQYIFPDLASGSYVLTVSKAGYVFDPASSAVTINGTNTSGVNFASTSSPVSQGVITALGSVVVNGIIFGTHGAGVKIDGHPGTEDQLKVGMIVKVWGTNDDASGAGTASLIEAADALEGTIQSVGANSLTVMGQTVWVEDNATRLNDDNLLKTFAAANFQVGDLVEVHGFPDDQGGLRATRVLKKTTGEFVIKGFIVSLGAGSFGLSLTTAGAATLTVNFTGPLPAGIAVGSRIEVKAHADPDPVAGTITAASIRLEDPLGPSGGKARVEGIVTGGNVDSFLVNGRRIITSSATLFQGGLKTDFAPGIKIEADGLINANQAIAATRITFRSNIKIEADITALTAGSSLTVLGKQVAMNPFTRIDNGTVMVGSHVAIHAFPDRDGNLIAARVSVLNPDTRVELQGPVTAIDAASGTMVILGNPVSTNAVTVFRASSTAADPAVTSAQFFSQLRINVTVVKVRWANAAAFPAGAVEQAEIEIGK